MKIRSARAVSRLQWLVPVLMLSALGSCVLPSQAWAQQRLEGKYRCVQIEVESESAACQSPPLVLNRDGSYKIWGESGTYQVVKGRWLVLSHSKRRGAGHFVLPGQIVFEYQFDGRRCRVTFRRTFEPPPGLSWS
jgi:hypothetical protein